MVAAGAPTSPGDGGNRAAILLFAVSARPGRVSWMKIVAKQEYEFKWVSIWVGNFASHQEVRDRAEAVLLPELDAEGYEFEDLAEWTNGEGAPRPLAAMMGEDFMWQIYEVPPVLAAAAALKLGPINGFFLLNHCRCEAGPHDFPGFTFLGSFPSWANPEEP